MTKITFEEWKSEVDRINADKNKPRLTDEQIEMIRYARSKHISYRAIAELFSKHYFKIGVAGMHKWCQKLGIK